jgi:hypothetical protein
MLNVETEDDAAMLARALRLINGKGSPLRAQYPATRAALEAPILDALWSGEVEHYMATGEVLTAVGLFGDIQDMRAEEVAGVNSFLLINPEGVR